MVAEIPILFYLMEKMLGEGVRREMGMGIKCRKSSCGRELEARATINGSISGSNWSPGTGEVPASL